MARILFLIYAGIAYALAMLNIAYLVGFLADFGVPKAINDGNVGPFWRTVLINVGLVALFGIHHSTTARQSFKRWWTRYMPPAIERATYLYMTAAMTCLLVYFWQPLPATVWQVESALWSGVIVTAYLAAWAMMFAATFHFGHFSFFGLRQAWDRYRNRSPLQTSFAARYLYALSRHPISLGWMLTPWLTPHMTIGQIIYAISVTVYVLIATKFEEADLIRELGDDYRRYRTQVPTFVPGTRPNRERVTDSTVT